MAEDGGLNGLKADRGSWSTDPTSQPQGACSEGVRTVTTRGRCRQSREHRGATQVSALAEGEADRRLCVEKFIRSRRGIVGCGVALLEGTERSGRWQRWKIG